VVPVDDDDCPEQENDMTSLTVNDQLLAVLNEAKGLSEIRDSAGNVVGFFAPVAVKDAQRYALAAAHIDPARVQRAKEETGPGRTTAEVLERLASLEKT
jgi:hypothetical protein